MMESESDIGNGRGWEVSPLAAMDAIRLALTASLQVKSESDERL